MDIQLLSGRYKLIQELGVGGMGRTFIAEDQQRPSNPKCVVKQLEPASKNKDFLIAAKRLFIQEAEILEKLGSHSNIPNLLAYFEEDQAFYLVQQFIEGHPLRQELQLGHRWSEGQVVVLLEQVLNTLQFVHRNNVIHRDIKPDNLIRRDRDGQLFLIDFGAVKQLQTNPNLSSGVLVSKTVAIGTEGYSPTEQLSGHPRLSSDIYSLGIICIQALTGMLPTQFIQDDDGEIIWQEQAQVSPPLGEFLKTMIRHYFKHRYQNASEALEALEGVKQRLMSGPPPEPAQAYNQPGQNSHPNRPQEKVPVIKPLMTPRSSSDLPSTLPPQSSHLPPTIIGNENLKNATQPAGIDLSENGLSSLANAEPHKKTFPQNKLPLILGGTAVAVLLGWGLISTLAFQENYSSAEQAQLDRLKAAQQNEDFSKCIEEGNQVLPQSPIAKKAEAIVEDCQNAKAERGVNQAQEFMAQKQWDEAIALLQDVPNNSPRFNKATELLQEAKDKRNPATKTFYQDYQQVESILVRRDAPEAYDRLFIAAEQAIQDETAEVMLAELKRDETGKFASLSGNRPEWKQLIKFLENSNPEDYELTYERARLQIPSTIGHSREFDLLFSATKKAIATDSTQAMLQRLTQDQKDRFYNLSRGHREWEQINRALKTKNPQALSS